MSTVTGTLGLLSPPVSKSTLIILLWAIAWCPRTQPVPHKTLLFFKGAQATTSVMKDAPVGCNAQEGEKFSQAMDNASHATWCSEGNNDVSSHKPQRCTDETAVQGHGKIINIISLCCYRWTNIALVGVQQHCSLQPKPAAQKLLQPTAVLSAQIITKDRPPSKEAFQMNPSLLVLPRKNVPTVECSGHTKGTFRTGAPSETQPQRQRAQDNKSLSHTK